MAVADLKCIRRQQQRVSIMTHSIVVISYILILIGVAVHKSRTVKSADDFMIAGRSVPVYMLVATLVCTWIGSGSLFGTAGLTFRTGISELWFSAGAWVGILVVYLIAARVRRAKGLRSCRDWRCVASVATE